MVRGIDVARINTVGFDSLPLALQKVVNALPEVAEEMIDAACDVLEPVMKRTATEYNIQDTGITIRSIGRGKLGKRKSDGSLYKDIYPQGKDEKGVRNAQKAFIAEYGKKGVKPRPFMRVAREECAEQMEEAMAKVYVKRVSQIVK